MTSTLVGRLAFSAAATAFALFRYSLSSDYSPTPTLRSTNVGIEIAVADDVDEIAVYTPEANADKIVDLPGLSYDPGFNQFSGYLTVDEENGRRIHYWYVESQNDPAKDKVVFWTNGGPGCSGMLGFGTEHGPFFYDEKGNLSPNPYSWNQVASILYVEQPAGVGFSFSGTESDYTTGDAKAASDNFVLIQEFFKKFPERQDNEFYIASESYGGHYIPQLTKEILDRNTDGKINFRGFLVGNPYVDPPSNTWTRFASYYSHGLLPKPLYDTWVHACTNLTDDDDDTCSSSSEAIFNQIVNSDINPYALDYPVCKEKPTEKSIVSDEAGMSSPSLIGSLHSPSSQGLRLLYEGGPNPPFLPPQDRYKPCLENYFTTYLNRHDVQSALHVNTNVTWDACSDLVNYSTTDLLASQIELYTELISMGVSGEHDLKMLVFSGDDDSICSTAGTQFWIYDLGVDPKKNKLWNPWKVNKQTAGFVTEFDLGENAGGNFVFATVHGAGHEVPSYRPLEALELFKSYLSGEW